MENRKNDIGLTNRERHTPGEQIPKGEKATPLDVHEDIKELNNIGEPDSEAPNPFRK